MMYLNFLPAMNKYPKEDEINISEKILMQFNLKLHEFFDFIQCVLYK
jgi:hypothetical protein